MSRASDRFRGLRKIKPSLDSFDALIHTVKTRLHPELAIQKLDLIAFEGNDLPLNSGEATDHFILSRANLSSVTLQALENLQHQVVAISTHPDTMATRDPAVNQAAAGRSDRRRRRAGCAPPVR